MGGSHGEQELLELVFCNLSSLWQSIHAMMPDFHIDMTILDKHMQVVMVHDVRRKDCHRMHM